MDTTKKVFIVKPLLSALEQKQLIQDVYQHIGKFQYQYPSQHEILSIVGKYVDDKTYDLIEKEISKLVVESPNHQQSQEIKLSDIIVPQAIMFKDVNNIEEAISASCIPLINEGYCTHDYLQAMLKQCREKPEYYLIHHLIYFPHSKIEDGALKLGIGITKLKKSIKINNNEVQYIICLSAIDNYSHLTALAELLKLVETKKLFDIFEREDVNYILSEIQNSSNEVV